MKHLIILRHAKSAWDDTSVSDHNRPLAPRGERAALVIGRYLRQLNLPIDLALSSTARRARDTWALVSTQLDALITTETDAVQYLKGPAAIRQRLAQVGDAAKTVVIVGHNPDFERLAKQLSSDGPADDLKAMAQKFPTGGLARIDVAIDRWADMPDATGTLVEFTAPRFLV